MSQAEVLKAVTSEWQTTAEVVERVPKDGRISPVTHRGEVYRCLWLLHRNGIVEKRTAPRGGRGGYNVAEWRLAR